MKKTRYIVAVTAFAIFAVADLVHDFVANDPIGYFSTEPRRLLYVAAIAIAGGLATLGYYGLSPRVHRHIELFGRGAAASIMTAFVGYCVYRFLSFAAYYGGSVRAIWLLPLLLMLSGIAAYLWYEFCRAWKKEVSR